MSNTVLTIILAFIVIILALLGLGIGYLLTGQSRLRSSCGQDPNARRGKSCNKNADCSVCGQKNKAAKPGDDS